VGWQPVLMAFFVSVFPALVFGVVRLALKKGQGLPFGPSLGAGVMLTLFLWPFLGRYFWPLYSEPLVLLALAGAAAFLLVVVGVLLRLLRGVPADAAGAG
jgi:hypothetical protein